MTLMNLPSFVVVLALLYARGVESLPTGAPAAACNDLTPRQNSQGGGHTDSAQSTPVPYIIDLSPFDDNGTFQYTPGQTYNLNLSSVPGSRAPTFRGFFIQARITADDTTRVGSFEVVDTTNSRLSDCPTGTEGITHSNRDDKTSISFRWTAPPQGTGEVTFRFAVVQTLNMYWASQSTPRTIAEGESEMVSTSTTEANQSTPRTTAEDSSEIVSTSTTEAVNEITTGAAHLTNGCFWTVLMVAVGLILNAAV